MLLQATLNGGLTKADHGAVPVTVEELAADAAECVAAGARAFHVHPRDQSGAESMEARVVDTVVTAVRAPHGMPVGVTTGEWIQPDLPHRLRLIRQWRQPDYTSVNLSEPGAVEVMQALLETGIGIEAGFALPHLASYHSVWASMEAMTWPLALLVAVAAAASMVCSWIMICSVPPRCGCARRRRPTWDPARWRTRCPAAVPWPWGLAGR